MELLVITKKTSDTLGEVIKRKIAGKKTITISDLDSWIKGEENNVNCDIDGSQVQAVFKNMKW